MKRIMMFVWFLSISVFLSASLLHCMAAPEPTKNLALSMQNNFLIKYGSFFKQQLPDATGDSIFFIDMRKPVSDLIERCKTIENAAPAKHIKQRKKVKQHLARCADALFDFYACYYDCMPDVFEESADATDEIIAYTNKALQHQKNSCKDLFFAVDNNRIALVKKLVAQQVDIHSTDNQGRCVLHFASNADMMKILLNAGADKNQRDDRRLSPLHYAVRAGREDCVRLLVSDRDSLDQDNLREAVDFAKRSAALSSINSWNHYNNPRILPVLLGCSMKEYRSRQIKELQDLVRNKKR